jgi:hypothetical protein
MLIDEHIEARQSPLIFFTDIRQEARPSCLKLSQEMKPGSIIKRESKRHSVTHMTSSGEMKFKVCC